MATREFEGVAALRSEIKSFAKADNDHNFRMWTIISGVILHAADHGDCDPMSELFNAVSKSTKDIMKKALREINRTFGQNHKFGPNADVIFPVFSAANNQDKTARFFLTKELVQSGVTLLDDLDEVKKVRKAILSEISSKEPADIRLILMAEKARTDAEVSIDPTVNDKAISNFVKKMAASHGLSKDLLDAINKQITTPTLKVNVGQKWDEGSNPFEKAKQELEAAQAKVAAFEKAKAEMPANDDAVIEAPAKAPKAAKA